MTDAPIVAVRVATASSPGARLLAPLGLASSLGSVAGRSVEHGRIVETLGEVDTGRQAALIAGVERSPPRSIPIPA